MVGFVGLAPEVEGGAGFHVVRSIEGFGNVVKFYFPTEQMQFISSVFQQTLLQSSLMAHFPLL